MGIMATTTVKKTTVKKPAKAKKLSLAERRKEFGNWKKESGVVIKMPNDFNRPMKLVYEDSVAISQNRYKKLVDAYEDHNDLIVANKRLENVMKGEKTIPLEDVLKGLKK